MAQKWTTRRPPMRLYTSWDGDNIAELEAAWPEWSFTANLNGTLHVSSTEGQIQGDIELGTWFTYDGAYETDPTLTTEVQDAPDPGVSGLVSFDLTLDS